MIHKINYKRYAEILLKFTLLFKKIDPIRLNIYKLKYLCLLLE